MTALAVAMIVCAALLFVIVLIGTRAADKYEQQWRAEILADTAELNARIADWKLYRACDPEVAELERIYSLEAK